MVNVLIVGATGYIGQALSQSLLRSGSHRVFGLARTPQKAKSLQAQEIIPIEGSITENASLLRALTYHHISVVVDVSGASQESRSLLILLKKIASDRLAVARDAKIRIPKLGFIYCSGTWVHGTSNEPVNDLMPVGALNAPTVPAQLTAWRPQLEQEVLAAADVMDVMVVRPALVYGRAGAIWSSLFEQIHAAAENGASTVTLKIEPDSRPGLIHVDDVASGFHVAIDKLPLISGTGVYPVFDLVTSQESMRDVLEASAREFGFKGKVELAGTEEDLFMKALSTSFSGSSGRARELLGWEPKRLGMAQGMDIFAKAWVASRE